MPSLNDQVVLLTGGRPVSGGPSPPLTLGGHSRAGISEIAGRIPSGPRRP
jgi:hypothetical protein